MSRSSVRGSQSCSPLWTCSSIHLVFIFQKQKLYTLDQWNFDFPLWCRNKSSTIDPVNDTACSFTTRPLRMRHRHSPAAGQEPENGNRTYSWRIIRFLPKFMPDWEAPLLVPYWREMTFWLALSVSSEKWRGLASDLRGHTLCPV